MQLKCVFRIRLLSIFVKCFVLLYSENLTIDISQPSVVDMQRVGEGGRDRHVARDVL